MYKNVLFIDVNCFKFHKEIPVKVYDVRMGSCPKITMWSCNVMWWNVIRCDAKRVPKNKIRHNYVSQLSNISMLNLNKAVPGSRVESLQKPLWYTNILILPNLHHFQTLKTSWFKQYLFHIIQTYTILIQQHYINRIEKKVKDFFFPVNCKKKANYNVTTRTSTLVTNMK
jgi:hypothetical protein